MSVVEPGNGFPPFSAHIFPSLTEGRCRWGQKPWAALELDLSSQIFLPWGDCPSSSPLTGFVDLLLLRLLLPMKWGWGTRAAVFALTGPQGLESSQQAGGKKGGWSNGRWGSSGSECTVDEWGAGSSRVESHVPQSSTVDVIIVSWSSWLINT